jgi:hypothetical protein
LRNGFDTAGSSVLESKHGGTIHRLLVTKEKKMNDLAIEWQSNKKDLYTAIHAIRRSWFVDERELINSEISGFVRVATREYVENEIAKIENAIVTYKSTLNRLDELKKMGAEKAFYEWQGESIKAGN